MGDELEASSLKPIPAHLHISNRKYQARLKSHARAFEGLMSLIPAKEYYGKDASITSVCCAPPPTPHSC